jgi:ElaB/YqjD/DUF883 family membrane-anchored ribosome-binding protein
MAGLTVKEAMEKIDQVEKDLNEKFTKLVDELKSVLSENGNTISESTNEVEVGKLGEKIEAVKQDLIDHVRVYNKHIIQQHGRSKG